MADKPSFFSSLTSGAGGYVKGLLAGVAFGAVAGAIVGGILGALVSGGIGAPAAAVAGAEIGMSLFGTIGAISGAATAVVKKHQEDQISAEDVSNAVKVAYAQGITMGKAQEKEAETTRWRKQEQERAIARTTSQPSQNIH